MGATLLNDSRLPGADDQTTPASALWFPAAGKCEMRSEVLAPLSEGEVRVRTLFSGISRGTEALVFAGKVPESEALRMRGPNMGGEFPFPVKYGYSAVGTVEAGSERLRGQTVFCLHPHQDRFITGESVVTPIPNGLPPERAILAANMETALNIVWDGEILPGDRVAVFGAGVVGALVAYLASRIVGTDVLLVDRNTERQSLAASLNLSFASTQGLDGEFDVLVNASGSGEALQQALDHAGQEARIVEASWHGNRPATLPLGGAFHSRRLCIVSSQVGLVPPARRIRWNFQRRLAKALELLRDDCLDALISGETPFADIANAYPSVLADPGTLCHRICY